MIDSMYRERVKLLLKIIPHVAKEKVFSLKGGTAINLFLRDFPRLSVDIDLVYLPFDQRDIALKNISDALSRIRDSITRGMPEVQITSIPISEGQDVKLICQMNRAQVKVEVNTVSRGHLHPLAIKRIAPNVEKEFELFAAMQMLSNGEIYGSKICAALDRQHPRDLFDVKYLLNTEGITPEIKLGLIASLLSHPRPIHEILKPRIIDQRQTFESQFQGMSFIPFTYQDHEQTLELLLDKIDSSLSDVDRKFLLSFKAGEPEWELDKNYQLLKQMPAVQWKIININKLKASNPEKHKALLTALERKLEY